MSVLVDVVAVYKNESVVNEACLSRVPVSGDYIVCNFKLGDKEFNESMKIEKVVLQHCGKPAVSVAMVGAYTEVEFLEF